MSALNKIMRSLVVIFGLVATGAIIWQWREATRTLNAARDMSFGTVAPFSLTDQRGKLFSSNALEGKIWLANFIFTRCMGPCPLITSKTLEIQKEFKNSPLEIVSFTVDPKFDQPAVLAKYAKGYGADESHWHFLTGPKKDVYTLIKDSFRLAVEGAGEEGFVHSTLMVIVDGKGSIKGYYDSTDAEAMAKLKKDLSHLVS